MTFEGLSNITTLHVSVNNIPSSKFCGEKKYVMLVVVFLERASKHINITRFLPEEVEPVDRDDELEEPNDKPGMLSFPKNLMYLH